MSDSLSTATSVGYKLVPLRILDVLDAQSDEGHPLTARQITQALEEGGFRAERKTVERYLEQLEGDDRRVHCEHKRRGNDDVKTNWYREPLLDPTEARLLADSLVCSRNMPQPKKVALWDKLRPLGGRAAAHIAGMGTWHSTTPRPVDDNQLFNSVEAIDEAMRTCSQVSFMLGRFDDAGRLVRTPDRSTPIVVNPLLSLMSGGHYYLVASYPDNEGKEYSFRVDLMLYAQVATDEDDRSIRATEGPRSKRDTKAYVDGHPLMFGGEPERVEFRMRDTASNRYHVLDQFGMAAVPLEAVEEDGGTYIHVSVLAPENGMLLWALGFSGLKDDGSDAVEVLSPASLRERLRERGEQLAARYAPAG